MPTEPNPNTMNVDQDLQAYSKEYVSTNLVALCQEELEISPCDCLHHDHLIELWDKILMNFSARRLVTMMIHDAAVARIAAGA